MLLKLISISELASEFCVTTRTIRFYEEKGLLSPISKSNKKRYYSEDCKKRLGLILKAKKIGLTLNEILDLIGPPGTNFEETEQYRKSLKYGKKYLKKIKENISELEALAEEISNHNKYCQKKLLKINQNNNQSINPLEEVCQS